MDKTHLRFFTPDTASELINISDLHIKNFCSKVNQKQSTIFKNFQTFKPFINRKKITKFTDVVMMFNCTKQI